MHFRYISPAPQGVASLRQQCESTVRADALPMHHIPERSLLVSVPEHSTAFLGPLHSICFVVLSEPLHAAPMFPLSSPRRCP
jgi:hypothetical protein